MITSSRSFTKLTLVSPINSHPSSNTSVFREGPQERLVTTRAVSAINVAIFDILRIKQFLSKLQFSFLLKANTTNYLLIYLKLYWKSWGAGIKLVAQEL